MRQGKQEPRIDPVMRLEGDAMGEELIDATRELGASFPRGWPSPVFKTLNAKKAKAFSPGTLCTAIVAAAKHPHLKQPAWNRFRGRVVGAIDARVVPIPTSLMSAHLQETRDEGESNEAEIAMLPAYEQGDIVALRKISLALGRSIFSKQQLKAKVDARVLECVSNGRGGNWA